MFYGAPTFEVIKYGILLIHIKYDLETNRLWDRFLLYSRNTNISGNIINHNLRTSMNERTHFFIKIYLSHFILERVDVSVVCERWVERHILRERTSSHIFFKGTGGANAYIPSQAHQRRLCSAASPSLNYDSLPLSKSERVVLITWSPSGYTPVRPECPDTPSSSCLLIKMWQLTKAHGVTRNEPKIHGICYLTFLNKPELICSHAIKWFWVLQFNTRNEI